MHQGKEKDETMNQKMKIITLSAIKGGVGKTTITYNYGEWLADHGYKILLIDLDHQCNLSQTYKIYSEENNVGKIFDPDANGDVKVHSVKPNIDLIAGDMQLDEKEEKIENQSNKNMLLYLWLYHNIDRMNLEQYDFILIDTHPDFSLATKNAIVVSNDVLSPITPSEHGYKAKWNLEIRFNNFKDEAIDFNTMKSFVTANLYFIANMIEKGRNSTKELLTNLQEEREKGDTSCIGIIPRKEMFNRSTLDKIPVSEQKKRKSIYHANKEFFDEIDNTFNSITKKM